MSPPPAVPRGASSAARAPGEGGSGWPLPRSVSDTGPLRGCPVAAGPTRLRRVPPLRPPHLSRFRLAVHESFGLGFRAMPSRVEEHRYCREVLPRVSRTFAISIGLLRGSLQEAVRIGYLLCRIADALEDSWPGDGREIRARFDALV